MASFLQVENLSKSYGDRMLFEDVTFGINEGDKVGIVAKNGTGKSTMLSILAGDEDYDSGRIVWRNDLRVGYLAQKPDFTGNPTVAEAALQSDDPIAVAVRDYEAALASGDAAKIQEMSLHLDSAGAWDYEDRLRQLLGQLGIHDLQQRVDKLSGGQRKRVALAAVLMRNPDFLILDEPTNHLDIMSKEILEDALCGYTGTVLYVSHDRYFINRTAHRILDLNRRTLTNYLGNYDYYLEKREEQLAKIDASLTGSQTGKSTASQNGTSDAPSGAKQDWKAKKEQQAAQRKRENDLKKCEERIEALETRNEEIDTLMASPEICTDVARLQELNREKEGNEAELSELYEKWEALSLEG